ncbi:glycosyltransferase (GT2) [Formosa agariphila KMM 3901]|uniref:Glycosyltransferase (GT2) n=1 Tax=Formosa agariphila (strain DSM 15362 / KCTC 12365 / LMG 23005 / KMM 3901 / M-2Alg 35-1) TaxID=1347342 RepID=T2KJQ8_FORAG|nr:glycosyltransferase [Formosa agariphila]CDF78229.1 glycosyltransferase (GT2) [Formosa agariphila KMM 3901]
MVALDILFYSFVAIVFIQLFYYLVFLRTFAFLKPTQPQKTEIPVSIIVCAKNEEENLKQFLPSVLNQDYPNFEVVLINDASHDETLSVFEHFSEQYNNIRIVDVKNTEAFWANKKYALTLGIKAAKHNHLVFTDADCRPTSTTWISEIAAHFNHEKSIVLGYGGYAKIKNSFLNMLIRFETVLTASQYFSYAKLGLPYMGVGRNLAYTKTLFFEANGFINHMNVRSGDDDLFVNQMASSKNTALSISPESFTESVPKKTFGAWVKQKRRHVSTVSYYKKSHKFLLGLFYVSQILFWILGIVLLSLLFRWEIVIGLFTLRILIQWIVMGKSAKKLNESDLVFIIPFLEIFVILTQLAIFISNKISKPQTWK